MQIKPVIKGVIARSAHPLGCEQAILQQIRRAQSDLPITHGPKRVLILGASSGYGLAARIALTFGGAQADTIGVSFERRPSEHDTGSAGFYNNRFFKQQAEKIGRVAVNLNGDVFSQAMKNEVIEAIETYFEGEVDLIIYSIASGKRRKPGTNDFWYSAIKPIGSHVHGNTINLETNQWDTLTIPPASDQEVAETIKVMGGEDWEEWVDTLINVDSIAPHCKTIALSYMGPDITHPIYLDGTLGQAKIDLHQTSHALNLKLANYDGGAYAAVCKATITKASMVIPGLVPYMLALYKVMNDQGRHEEAIEQMQRLFRDKLYGQNRVPVDGERLIRMDDYELSPDTQQRVSALLARMNGDNFQHIGDYTAFVNTFLQLNGFGFAEINYQTPTDLTLFAEPEHYDV